MRKPLSTAKEIEWLKLKRKIAEAANAHGRRFAGCGIDQVQKTVDEHELVYAAWNDPKEDGGVGILVVKGHSLLRMVIADNAPVAASMTAIPCRCREEGIALRMAVGEPELRR